MPLFFCNCKLLLYLNMTKEELKQYFEANGGRGLAKTDKAWTELFNLYKQETKNRLSLGCGGCYSVAYKWLQK